MKALYITEGTWKGGKTGRVRSDDGILDLEIRSPKELGGDGGPYTNPEQLFAVGYASCFASAINLAATQKV